MDISKLRVTLMGLGSFERGSGVMAALFLAPRVKRLVITDIKTKKELAPQIARLSRFRNIVWRLGRHETKDFTATDWIIRNPDVPVDSPYLAAARKKGIPIDNDVTLFLRLHGTQETVGVTGTRGKTTTTTLLHRMIQAYDPGAFCAGNVGVSPLLKKQWLDPSSCAVLELSSFLLHEFGERKLSPHIAVYTNLYRDHLNKYRSFKKYYADKEHLFRHQHEGDWVVLNADDPGIKKHVAPAVKKACKRTGSSVLLFSVVKKVTAGAFIDRQWVCFRFNGATQRVMPLREWKLPGRHNVYNLLASVAAARAYGVPATVIRTVASRFSGVPYRLEFVRTLDGVRYYNDSAATSPEGAMAALRSFPTQKTVLISGGNSKNLDITGLSREIRKRVRVLIKMPGTVSSELPSGVEAKDLNEAVKLAHAFARKGDTVLLSPGLTWLPLMNEFKRGDEFKKLVKALK